MRRKPSQKPAKPASKTQNRASNLSIGSLSPDEALQAMLSISPADVKKVLASKPGKK